jgi:DNA-3-methyladenine glycosylase II
MGFLLTPTPPYNFDLTMRTYGILPGEVVDSYVDGVYRRVLKIEDEHVLVSVESIGTVDEPRLRVSVRPNVSTKLGREVRRKVRHMLNTDVDVRSFYSAMRRNRVLSRVVDELYGLRATKTESLYEALVIAITEQQISLRAAVAIRGRIARRYGRTIVLGDREYCSFPSEDVMARANPQRLRDMGLSARKAEYIVGLSRQVARGELNLEGLAALPTEDLVRELTRIRGVGTWTAEYAVVRGLGRFDALPADDAALRRVVSALYYCGREVTGEEVRRLLDEFGQHRGLVAFYLLGLELLGREPFTTRPRYC